MIVADLSASYVLINGARFQTSCPAEEIYSVLGQPSRILSTGMPAPYGHRNNQRHVYDDVGIYLLEHHARQTIDGICFVFNPSDEANSPESPFLGTLTIAGQPCDSRLDVSEFVRTAPVPFKPHLGRWYYYDGESISITVTTFSRGKTKSGRWSKVCGIASIEGDFRDKGSPISIGNSLSISPPPARNAPGTIEEEIAELATEVVHFPTTRGHV
jgi:hypothetical protein